MTVQEETRGGRFERIAKMLEATGEFRVLRRLRSPVRSVTDHRPCKRAIFLDVETTGLDHLQDTVIELAMLPFDYDVDGEVVAIGEPFQGFRDPGVPISSEISALTGITDSMVAGTSIDPREIEKVVEEAAIVIAHNARFDRPFCEKLWPTFAAKAWACSWREVDWKAHGFGSARLSDIVAGYGLYFNGHRAVEDCHAGIEVLSRELPGAGRTALAMLLESARETRWRVWATGAPFPARSLLKKRGYRWSAGDDGRPRAWNIEVSEDQRPLEIQFLRNEVFRSDDIEVPANLVTAFDRYSTRD